MRQSAKKICRDDVRLTFLLGAWTVCALIFLMLIAFGCPANAQQALTNSDIIRMAHAHVGAGIIVQQVRNNPGNYSLTTDSIIQLEKQGVPDEAIAAMQAKESPRSPARREDHGASAGPCGASSERWQRVSADEGLSGSRQEVFYCKVFGQDSAQVSGFCDEYNHFVFMIDYISHDKDLAFNSFPFYESVTGYAANVRIRLDEGNVQTLIAPTKFKNEAELIFYPASDVAPSDPAQEQRLFGAHQMSIEFPLNDGRSPVVTFSLRDAAFRDYVANSSCRIFETSAPEQARHQPVQPAPISRRITSSNRTVDLSSGVAQSMRIGGAAPVYPSDARAAGVHGTVVLRIQIDRDGRVASAQIISAPSTSLGDAAKSAVLSWRYRPYLLSGNPVSVETTVNVEFRQP